MDLMDLSVEELAIKEMGKRLPERAELPPRD
jgi:hypothetical protein